MSNVVAGLGSYKYAESHSRESLCICVVCWGVRRMDAKVPTGFSLCTVLQVARFSCFLFFFFWI